MKVSKNHTKAIQHFLKSQSPLAKTLRKIAKGEWRTFLFGGAVREVLLYKNDRHIRDIDIVIDDHGFAGFQQTFKNSIVGINSFEGLRLNIDEVPVDAWMLSTTWAFKEGYIYNSINELPKTTFLNIDSIIFEITPRPSRKRLFATPFIDFLQTGVMDIVFEDNPFPNLAAVRAIKMYFGYNILMSRRLSCYIVRYLEREGIKGCLRDQMSHYHRIVVDEDRLNFFLIRLRVFLAGNASVMSNPVEQINLI